MELEVRDVPEECLQVLPVDFQHISATRANAWSC